GVDHIVYISCKATSLARDLPAFLAAGYKLEKACCVDQFCQTVHVETVVLLSQQKPDDTIEIDLDLDELDATTAETKGTYEEIKAYVWDKHHLKVSSLYISQVKIKCGLEVGQNYNLSKSENPKVPKCPPEKEAVIMGALKHFQMI
ncbi:MAG: 23S rRNA (uracil(1939)-C(5))-methyltransferase RlmD, partial [Dialister invisus]|nr:23S rRNA (uracil(1939)-C(5))-methyltransferase RlmD [Dialister invisus]